MNEIKTGVATSEFWKSLVTQVVGILVLFGVIGPEESNEWVQAVGGFMAVVGPAVYSFSRSQVKAAAATNGNDGS